jgi:hypothetical protein
VCFSDYTGLVPMHLLPPVTHHKDKVAPVTEHNSNILDIQTWKQKVFSFLSLLLCLGEEMQVPTGEKAVEIRQM